MNFEWQFQEFVIFDWILSCSKIAEEALEDMISWLATDQGDIGVFDATNTTRERRLWIMERCKSRQLDVLFVESICNDPKVIEENVLVSLFANCCRWSLSVQVMWIVKWNKIDET